MPAIRKGLTKFGTLVALTMAAPVLGVTLGAAPAFAQFGVDVRIGYAPPPLPDEYDQAPLPGPDYIWVPGTWAWSDDIDDYYWVPGYWDLPPEPGLLWTPAWWGWDDNAYRYHQGYWGHQVGWYGGIDYGHGYHGHGWDGGRWDNGHISYNRAVINVDNARVNRFYYAPVDRNRGPRVSYNGGRGGISAQPRPDDLRATNAQRYAPTQEQQQRFRQAAGNPRAAASQINPTWNPPAVHRVDNTGAPVARGPGSERGGQRGQGQNPQAYPQQRTFPGAPGAPAASPRAYQSSPGYGQQAPGTNGQARGYNGQTPGYDGRTAGYNGQAPAYNGRAPGYNGQAPGYNGQAPAYNGRAPEYDRQAPRTPPQSQPVTNTARTMPPQNTPQFGNQRGDMGGNRQTYQPVPQRQVQPAPNYGHAAPPQQQQQMQPRPAPQPQFHAAPPQPAPRPAAPPPPRPQPQRNDNEHHEHP